MGYESKYKRYNKSKGDLRMTLIGNLIIIGLIIFMSFISQSLLVISFAIGLIIIPTSLIDLYRTYKIYKRRKRSYELKVKYR
jgi:predicted ABC-type sugar transport system permease subunit